MQRFFHHFCFLLIALAGCAALPRSLAVTDVPHAIKRAVNPPPSAKLFYDITAQYGLLSMSGKAQIRWHAIGHRFDLHVETLAAGLGKILETHCEGRVNEYGLAPTNLTETRFLKKPHTVTFDHEKKIIRFSASPQTYPIQGGEQNRTSITWQLVAMARAAPDSMKPGTEWSFFVAGRKNAEVWRFRVMGKEMIPSPLGEIQALHIAKLPSPSREKQTLDLWLAPSLEWYPVKMLFTDEKGLTLNQVLQRIEKQPATVAIHQKDAP